MVFDARDNKVDILIDVNSQEAIKKLNAVADKLDGIGKVSNNASANFKKASDTISNSTKNVSANFDKASTKVQKLSEASNKSAGVISKLGGAFGKIGLPLIVANQGLELFNKLVGSVGSIVSGGIGLANLANEFEGLNSAFEGLKASVGEDGATAFNSLKSATKGLISDMDLLRSSNQALLLGVDDGSGKMNQLSEDAIRLGRAMGITAKDAVDSLVIGIGRQSKLVLDNLGVIVDAKTAYENFAEANNIVGRTLTDSEKKLAFQAEAFAQISEKASRLPDITNNVAQGFQVLGNTFESIKISIGQVINDNDVLSEAVGNLAESLGNFDVSGFISALATISGYAINAVSIMIDGFNFLSSSIGTAISPIAGIFKDVFDIAIAVVKPFFTIFNALLGGALSTTTDTTGGILTVIRSVTETIRNVVVAVSDFINKYIIKSADLIKSAYIGLRSAIIQVFTSLKQSLSEALNFIIRQYNRVAGIISDGIKIPEIDVSVNTDDAVKQLERLPDVTQKGLAELEKLKTEGLNVGDAIATGQEQSKSAISSTQKAVQSLNQQLQQTQQSISSVGASSGAISTGGVANTGNITADTSSASSSVSNLTGSLSSLFAKTKGGSIDMGNLCEKLSCVADKDFSDVGSSVGDLGSILKSVVGEGFDLESAFGGIGKIFKDVDLGNVFGGIKDAFSGGGGDLLGGIFENINLDSVVEGGKNILGTFSDVKGLFDDFSLDKLSSTFNSLDSTLESSFDFNLSDKLGLDGLLDNLDLGSLDSSKLKGSVKGIVNILDGDLKGGLTDIGKTFAPDLIKSFNFSGGTSNAIANSVGTLLQDGINSDSILKVAGSSFGKVGEATAELITDGFSSSSIKNIAVAGAGQLASQFIPAGDILVNTLTGDLEDSFASTGASVTTIASTLGSVFFGPLGGALAGLATTFINDAFGSKNVGGQAREGITKGLNQIIKDASLDLDTFKGDGTLDFLKGSFELTKDAFGDISNTGGITAEIDKIKNSLGGLGEESFSTFDTLGKTFAKVLDPDDVAGASNVINSLFVNLKGDTEQLKQLMEGAGLGFDGLLQSVATQFESGDATAFEFLSTIEELKKQFGDFDTSILGGLDIQADELINTNGVDTFIDGTLTKIGSLQQNLNGIFEGQDFNIAGLAETNSDILQFITNLDEANDFESFDFSGLDASKVIEGIRSIGAELGLSEGEIGEAINRIQGTIGEGLNFENLDVETSVGGLASSLGLAIDDVQSILGQQGVDFGIGQLFNLQDFDPTQLDGLANAVGLTVEELKVQLESVSAETDLSGVFGTIFEGVNLEELNLGEGGIGAISEALNSIGAEGITSFEGLASASTGLKQQLATMIPEDLQKKLGIFDTLKLDTVEATQGFVELNGVVGEQMPEAFSQLATMIDFTGGSSEELTFKLQEMQGQGLLTEGQLLQIGEVEFDKLQDSMAGFGDATLSTQDKIELLRKSIDGIPDSISTDYQINVSSNVTDATAQDVLDGGVDLPEGNG